MTITLHLTDWMQRQDKISRQDLATCIEASADSSHFGNMISAMKTAEVLTYPRDKYVRADETLFPEGLF